MSETRKLAAILVADVVGYSRLAGADEERTLARLRGLRSDLIDPAIEKQNTMVEPQHRPPSPRGASNFASASTLATSSRRATAISWVPAGEVRALTSGSDLRL